MSNDATIDAEVSQRKNSSFGKLSQKLWKRHNIRIDTNIAVAVVLRLSILLYGYET